VAFKPPIGPSGPMSPPPTPRRETAAVPLPGWPQALQRRATTPTSALLPSPSRACPIPPCPSPSAPRWAPGGPLAARGLPSPGLEKALEPLILGRRHRGLGRHVRHRRLPYPATIPATASTPAAGPFFLEGPPRAAKAASSASRFRRAVSASATSDHLPPNMSPPKGADSNVA
jgi:hypothetical protein